MRNFAAVDNLLHQFLVQDRGLFHLFINFDGDVEGSGAQVLRRHRGELVLVEGLLGEVDAHFMNKLFVGMVSHTVFNVPLQKFQRSRRAHFEVDCSQNVELSVDDLVLRDLGVAYLVEHYFHYQRVDIFVLGGREHASYSSNMELL